MAKKGKAEPEEAVATPEELAAAAAEQAAVIGAIVSDVVTGVADAAVERRLRRLEVPFAAATLLHDVSRALQLCFVASDAGDDVACDPSWVADAEPAPAPIDTWATGVVPVKSRRAVPRDATDAVSVAESVRSVRGSGRSRKAANAEASSPEKDAPQIIVREPEVRAPDPPPDTDWSVAFISGSEPMQEATPESEAEQQAMRLFEQRATQRRERQMRMLREQRTREERSAKVAKQYRGKLVTFDDNGEIIVVKPIDAAKLPRSAPLGVDFEGEHATKAGKSSSSASASSSSGNSPKRGGTAASRGGANRAHQRGFFLGSQSVQPSLMSTIKLVPGVNVAEAGQERRGPEAARDPGHMSRAAFLAMQDEMELNSGAGGAPEMEDADASPTSPAGSRAGSRASSPTPRMGGSASPRQRESSSPRPASRLLSRQGQGGTPGMPDYDPLDGAEARERARTAGSSAAWEDENETLTAASDWGVTQQPEGRPNIAAVPTKPNSRQRKLTHGTRPPPRDRPGHSPNSKKRFLPSLSGAAAAGSSGTQRDIASASSDLPVSSKNQYGTLTMSKSARSLLDVRRK